MSLTDPQIEKAVKFWMDALAKPEFKTLSDFERQNPINRHAEIAETLAKIASASNVVAEDKILKFGEELRTILREHRDIASLYVDYRPDSRLSEAAVKAGLDISIISFPWKTVMRFDNGRVLVSQGYGSPREVL